jgi:processing peptidase subunit alpha
MQRFAVMTKSLSLSRQLSRTARNALRDPTRFRQYASLSKSPPVQEPTELDQVTTLSNGIRVASEALPGHFSGIGVYVDAGSRYENENLRGVSHIIDRLAFKSTQKHTSDQMLEKMESLGGNIQCSSSRESLMYQSATFNSAVPDTVALLAETIREPNLTDEEVARQLETAEYEIGEIWSKPELILPELVHMAAYKDNTLGNPLLCPQERLEQIDHHAVEAYRKAFFRPERIVVAYAGVNHSEAVKLTEQYFGDMNGPSSSPDAQQIPSTSASHNASVSPSPLTQQSSEQPVSFDAPAHYTGGFLTMPPLPIPPNPALPRVSHIHLAFESLPIFSPDIYALATLQTLLGGGGSFSAGGPGKGMYSRLYTNVLNQYGWVENCVAFNHAYTDSGLFGISASCATQSVAHMLDTMARELSLLSAETGFGRLSDIEVKRAKNQLRSSLLMNLESRMVELEDLGRQVQVHGRRVPVKEMVANIEKVTIQDLRRVAKEVFGGNVQNRGRGSGAPTVVLQQGMEEGIEHRELSWNEIQERIAKWGLGRH